MKPVNLFVPEHEHEFEAVNGLPEVLPRGETLLWQGSPDPLALARQALHLDKVLVYFGLLVSWRVVSSLYDGATATQVAAAVAGMLPLIGVALLLLGVIAWLIARTSVYTITDRRLVMRVGVVLSVTFNLPFSRIASVDLRRRGKDLGDIAVTLATDERIAYLHLWPHAQAWQLKRTRPMMRALTGSREVAQTLAHALEQAELARTSPADAQRPLRAVVRPPSDNATSSDPAAAAARTAPALPAHSANTHSPASLEAQVRAA